VSPPTDGSGDAGDGADADATTRSADAFAVLGDPLRVAIVRELMAFHRETGTTDSIGFADLRRRVDVRDPGRFRYHLRKLRGRFVEKTDGGYRLTYAGTEVVTAVLTGTYTDNVSVGPETLDSDCFVCGEKAIANYGNGTCRVTCANDHPLFEWSVPPTAAVDNALPAVVSLAELLAYQGIERALAGVCPRCFHSIETEVVAGPEDVAQELSRPIFRAVCVVCGGALIGPVSFCLLVDPQVAALYQRHGRGLRAHHVWELPFVGDDSAIRVVEEDPIRVEIGVTLAGETLWTTIDERGHVVAVDSRSDAM